MHVSDTGNLKPAMPSVYRLSRFRDELRPRYRNTVRITRAEPGGFGAGAASLETPMA